VELLRGLVVLAHVRIPAEPCIASEALQPIGRVRSSRRSTRHPAASGRSDSSPGHERHL
jgi:hypothetical protein